MPRIYYACTGLIPTEWTVIIRHSDFADWRGSDEKFVFRGISDTTMLAIVEDGMARMGDSPEPCDFISSVPQFQMVDAATGLQARSGAVVFRHSFAHVLGVKGMA